jgi:xyloglucan fucosyltransferase
MFRIAPKYERKIREFKKKNFGLFTIGMQIRRRKCNDNEKELHCDLRPSIESYCAVARTIQIAHGLHDHDVRFFLAADEADTYTQVVHAI